MSQKIMTEIFTILATEVNKKWGTKYDPATMKFKDISAILDLVSSGKLHNIKEIPQFDE